MLRLVFLIPVLILSLVLFIGAIFLIYKLNRGIKSAFKKGVEIKDEQQRKWQKRSEYKHLTDFIKDGIKRFDSIKKEVKNLPADWQGRIAELMDIADDIVTLAIDRPKQARSIRPFFTVTLKSFKRFVEALQDDYSLDQDSKEEQKALQNITVFKADMLQFQEKLNHARRFDFDVVMDVIRQRIGKS